MQITSTPISPDKQQALSQWLEQPEFETLIEVLESSRFDVQVEAATLREKPADTRAVEIANGLDERVREISRTVATLNSLKQQKEPFTISSATP